jgi:hypothetical protein
VTIVLSRRSETKRLGPCVGWFGRQQEMRCASPRPIAHNPVHDSAAFREAPFYKTVHVDGQDLFVPDIDGHHCLFFAALMGATHIDMNLVWYPESLRTSQVGRKIADYETMIEEYLADEMRSDLNIATG